MLGIVGHGPQVPLSFRYRALVVSVYCINEGPRKKGGEEKKEKRSRKEHLSTLEVERPINASATSFFFHAPSFFLSFLSSFSFLCALRESGRGIRSRIESARRIRAVRPICR